MKTTTIVSKYKHNDIESTVSGTISEDATIYDMLELWIGLMVSIGYHYDLINDTLIDYAHGITTTINK